MDIKLTHKFSNHPTVLKLRSKEESLNKNKEVLSFNDFKKICLDFGVDDLGVVSLSRDEIQDQLPYIKKALPEAKTLISLVHRFNPDSIRSPYRSMANLEFHDSYEEANKHARKIVKWLQEKGFPSNNPSSGFPMEMDEFPGRIWVVSHKPVAAAAGLGMMGIHRNIIHPKFGNFINLGTIITTATFDHESRPIDYNPCVGCRLCVQACPVGAISPDGQFNMSTCMTHNYKEFMSGFNSWVNDLADSKDAKEFSTKHDQSENASMWQSLSFKSNYKAAYCMAVCPAGEDVMGEYLLDRSKFKRDYLDPLVDKEETIYAQAGSDAIEKAKKFPNKIFKVTNLGMRPKSVDSFLRSMPMVFQPQKSKGMDLSINFHFTGDHERFVGVKINNQKIKVNDSHLEERDLLVIIDSKLWVKFLREEISLLRLLLTRKLRFKGNLKKLKLFSQCFPK